MNYWYQLRKSFVVIFVATVLGMFLGGRVAFAHSPHDDIDAIVVSPDYIHDQTLFILVSGLRRSTDGGYSWKELSNGIDTSDAVIHIAISPDYRDDRTVLASTNGSGIYKSRDGGDSWYQVAKGLDSLDMGSIMFASADTAIVADANGGLYRSKDRGESWQKLMQGDAPITAMAHVPGRDAEDIYAADHNGVLYLCRKSGNNCSSIYRFEGAGAITALAAPESGVLFAGTEDRGIFKSTDAGQSFAEISDGLDGGSIIDVFPSPRFSQDETVYASTWRKAIYISDNGGESWELFSQGLTKAEQADRPKYRSPHFNYIRQAGDELFLGGFDGLFRSLDGGKTWTQQETLYVGLIRGLGVSTAARGQPAAVAIGSYGGGAYVSFDKGKDWVIKSRGLTTTRLSDIVFSPQFSTDKTMFSGAQGALLRSENDGDGWERIALHYYTWPSRIRRKLVSGLIRVGVPSYKARSILTRQDTLLVYPTGISLSPDFSNDGTLFFGTRYHGIYRSTDRGISSEGVWEEHDKVVTRVAISPDYPSDRTVYASVRDIGIYRSNDAGDSWQLVNNGIEDIADWVLSATESTIARDILLAISPGYKHDQTVFAATSTSLYRTTDRGDNWSRVKGLSAGAIIGLAISPDYQHDKTLLVSLKGKGLYTTTDGGETFTQYATNLIEDNYAIELIGFSGNYANDKTVYAASDEELFISEDGGESWKRLARPVRYENMRDVLKYEGEWRVEDGAEYSASSANRSGTRGSRVTLPFVGTGIRWIGRKSDQLGVGRVEIDNAYQGEVDQYSSDTSKSEAVSFSIDSLPYGAHSITVEVTGEKHPDSGGTDVVVDAFDVVR